jgi:hypothetical protein
MNVTATCLLAKHACERQAAGEYVVAIGVVVLLFLELPRAWRGWRRPDD